MIKSCFECGNPAEHDHHVVPHSLGGTKTVPLCTACHAKIHNVHAMGSPALTKSGLAALKRRGMQYGTIPYGYMRGESNERISRQGKKRVYSLIPNPAEQEVIALVKDLRGQGFSIRGIASELNRREIPTRMPNGQKQPNKTRNGKWQPTQIVRILAAPTPNHDGNPPANHSRDAFAMILE